ncbi:MAG: ABC transporter substrate-binding protein [Coriobacteriales bacterium]|jgi:ABC-type transport system substrate-binding protein|nr:ABC transporter substrate-binding protein [Coriobacteriales bacterium]
MSRNDQQREEGDRRPLGPTRRDFLKGAAATGGALVGASLLGALGGCVPLLRPRAAADDAAPDREPGQEADQGTGQMPGREGGSLAVASHWPYAIDPFFLQESAGIQIANCLFDPLVRYDYREKKLVGAAAQSWEANKEGTVFTFRLASGARFHNDDAVTAADFKYAWERILRPDASGGRSTNASSLAVIQGADALGAGEADAASGIKAVDELTLEVTLALPFHEFPFVLSYPAFSPVPSKVFADDGRDASVFSVMPIGNGAFMLKDVSTYEDDMLRLVRFDGYGGTPALLQAVEFRFFEADSAQQEPSEGGGQVWEVAARPAARPPARPAAMRPAVPAAARPAAVRLAVPAVARLAAAQSVAAAPPALRPAASPMLHPVADEPLQSYEEKAYERFRLGGLDLSSVPVAEIEDARARYGEAADGHTVESGEGLLLGSEACVEFLWGSLEREPLDNALVRQALSHAIDREAICKELFAGAFSAATGIIPPEVEGFRTGAWPATAFDAAKAQALLDEAGHPGGKGLAPLTLLAANSTLERRLFEMIEAGLTEAGFSVKLVVGADNARYWDMLQQGAVLTSTGWIADFPLMENLLVPLFSGSGSNNLFGYRNAEVDEGIAAARAVAEADERQRAFHKVDDLIAADMPVIPLFFTTHALVCSDRTNDLYVAPDGLIALPKVWVSF